MEKAHMKSVEETYKTFGVSETQGLDENAIEKALEKYGLNGMYFFSVWCSNNHCQGSVPFVLLNFVLTIKVRYFILSYFLLFVIFVIVSFRITCRGRWVDKFMIFECSWKSIYERISLFTVLLKSLKSIFTGCIKQVE